MAAYIWDLDGTLLDSYGVIVAGAKDAGVNALLYLEADSVVSPTGAEDRIVRSLREI